MPSIADTTLPPVAETELARLQEELSLLERGEADPEAFRRFRLQHGIYGIRGTADQYMVRVKIPFGALTPEQLEALAEVAAAYTPAGVAHLTTRQDVQFHRVRQQDLCAALRTLAAAGLTTREACGNTVRNVTACPFAGVSPTESFDVTPYAKAVAEYFLRNPICQDLPRKFKIAFEGCAEDHARTPIHDIGAVAALDGGRRGFRLYVGGGLGAAPRSADLLEEFTPAAWLIPTCEAILRVFDRHGNRADKNHARLKFLVKEWGIERFRQVVLAERRSVLATSPGGWPPVPEEADEAPPEPPPLAEDVPVPRAFHAWRRTNVLPQKQEGWNTVIVRCPLGDISAAQLRALAQTARRYAAGRIRTAISQNILLRWVPDAALPALFRELAAMDLARGGAHAVADITRCPGADTCNLAITHSRGLAAALGRVLEYEFARVPEVQALTVKISGCPNSCGQHLIADLGFYGTSRRVDGREVPHYLLLVGGRTEEGRARFARPVFQLPARRVPEAVRRILTHYTQQRAPEETFSAYVDRVGVAFLRELLGPLREVPPHAVAPEFYEDLGAQGEAFQVQVGRGECAS